MCSSDLLLDLVWVDLVAAAIYQVAESSLDPDEAGVVDAREITGAHIAVDIEPLPQGRANGLRHRDRWTHQQLPDARGVGLGQSDRHAAMRLARGADAVGMRSEERRVGKECRSLWAP